jgi:DNA-3-methyladenine glycosylase II
MDISKLKSFNSKNFEVICDHLALVDPDLVAIIDAYDYPPLWSRPNSYETLVHIILEQQVSLASAQASLEKLRLKVRHITPKNVAALSDEEFRNATISRQKAGYIKQLAQQIISGNLNIGALKNLTDDNIRKTLIKLKGIAIGRWMSI